MASMRKGKLTISIDLELAWGWWDLLTPEILAFADEDERQICSALLACFDEFEVPATWAIVAALLDRPSSQARPGHARCWYAPEIIEAIVGAKIRHEIGSHGGHHVYFDDLTAAAALADLEFAERQHRAHRLPFVSLVFPRNRIAHLSCLPKLGLRVFRGPDAGIAQAAARMGLGRL